MNEALSLKKAATQLDCSVATVRRMIKDKRLTAFRLTGSGHWRVNKSTLEKYIK